MRQFEKHKTTTQGEESGMSNIDDQKSFFSISEARKT